MNAAKNMTTGLRLSEIGRVHSPFKQATGTPIQPCRAGPSPGYAVLRPEFVPGLADLAGFERVWLIYWFHRASAPQMNVVPYRDTVGRGLFATRAPARPNPLGLSCVRLLNIEGNILRLGEVDIMDGTQCTKSRAGAVKVIPAESKYVRVCPSKSFGRLDLCSCNVGDRLEACATLVLPVKLSPAESRQNQFLTSGNQKLKNNKII
jgi:tRNA-Thr(GGU) m(6)t(6)A37 methyltransferase TsaA